MPVLCFVLYHRSMWVKKANRAGEIHILFKQVLYRNDIIGDKRGVL